MTTFPQPYIPAPDPVGRRTCSRLSGRLDHPQQPGACLYCGAAMPVGRHARERLTRLIEQVRSIGTRP